MDDLCKNVLNTWRKQDIMDLCKRHGICIKGNKNKLIMELLNKKEVIDELRIGNNFDVQDDDSENETRGDALLVSELEQYKAEIDLLRKQNDLLIEQNEQLINKIEKNKKPTIFGEYEGLLEEFSATNDQNFKVWRIQLNSIIKKYDLDECAILCLLTKKLKGRPLAWLRSRSEHIEAPVWDIINEMEKLFDSRKSRLTRRREFENRKWNSSEIFSEYFHDKLIMANELCINDGESIDFIIDGIRDENLQNQARAMRFKSTHEFLDAFAEIQYKYKFKPYVSKLEVSSTSEIRYKKQGYEKSGPLIKQNVATNEDKLKLLRCYNCNEVGHIASKCTKQKRERGSCYLCGDDGHKLNDCKVQRPESRL